MMSDKSRDFNENMLDSMLALACGKALDDEIAELPADEDIDHVFSPEFERRMKNLINRETRKSRVLKWRRMAMRVAIVIIVMAFGFASLMNVSAFRIYVLNTVREFGEGYLGFQFAEDEPAAPEYQEPSYLPEGFAEERRDSYGDSLYITYTNEEKEEISLYIIYKQSGSSFNIDNEDRLSYSMVEGGTIINVLDGTGVGKSITIYWEDSRYFYEISAKYDVEELLKTAKSMID